MGSSGGSMGFNGDFNTDLDLMNLMVISWGEPRFHGDLMGFTHS